MSLLHKWYYVNINKWWFKEMESIVTINANKKNNFRSSFNSVFFETLWLIIINHSNM